MSSERVQRDQIVLFDNEIMGEFPIHFAGAALLCRNASADAAVLTIEESTDGTTWGTVLQSTKDGAGLSSVTIAGLSFASILFHSTREFVRFSLATVSDAGVYISLVQFPPKGVDQQVY